MDDRDGSVGAPDPERGCEILVVLHESRVAAIQTADGPRRLLAAGLVDRLSARAPVDLVEIVLAPSESTNEIEDSFLMARRVSHHVRTARERGRFPVVLGGSCHLGLGTLAGLGPGRCGVLWLDCHGDLHTPDTTTSGFLDGTTLATMTGRGWERLGRSVPGFEPVRDEDVVLVGARDLEPAELSLLAASHIERLSATDSTARAEGVLRKLARRVDRIHVHLDLDVLEPTEAPANRYATLGGMSPSSLLALLGRAKELCPLAALSVASYDPAVDPGNDTCDVALSAIETVALRG